MGAWPCFSSRPPSDVCLSRLLLPSLRYHPSSFTVFSQRCLLDGLAGVFNLNARNRTHESAVTYLRRLDSTQTKIIATRVKILSSTELQKVFECNTLRFAAIVSHYTQDCYLKEGLKDFLNELK